MPRPIRGPFALPHPFARVLGASITGKPTRPPPSRARVEAAHQALYDAVPAFACIPGCTQCCGAVAMTAWEWARIGDKRKAAPDCFTCPYSAEANCAIHADRPLICRLFGAVDDPRMTCPRGCGPEQKLTAEQGHALMSQYMQLSLDC